MKKYNMSCKYVHKISSLLFSISFTLFILIFGCGTTGELREYKNISEKTIDNDALEKAEERIDNNLAYEVYFRLEKPVDCIRIAVTSEYVPDRFTGKKEHIMTYFILDQLIDISSFKGAKQKYEISQIGKNYDVSWNRRRNLTICSGPQFPLLRLDDKTIYRLRFTNFRDVSFTSKISIHADCRVSYLKNPNFNTGE